MTRAAFTLLETSERQKIIDSVYRVAVIPERKCRVRMRPPLTSIILSEPETDDLTLSFVRLTDLPTYRLDWLSRYETTLWASGLPDLLYTAVLRPPEAMGKTKVALAMVIESPEVFRR